MSEIISLENIQEYKFCIPEYQRPYVWGTEQVRILLEDLRGEFEKQEKCNPEEKTYYLLGSLILYKNGKSSENQESFDVVDGQQRLTTLALILKALDKVLDKKPEANAQGFMLVFKSPHMQSQQHIKKNFNYIQDWLTNHKSLVERGFNKDWLLTKLEFIVVFAPSLDEAFIFFDSANAKGKKLEHYDLMKAFHLRNLKDNQKEFLLPYYAKQFEEFAKSKDKDGGFLQIIFEEILAPLRMWVKGKNLKSDEIKVYEEFCQEYQNKQNPMMSRVDLGVVQGIVGGADFFEYLIRYSEIYQKILKDPFYQELQNIWGTGFYYNRLFYAVVLMLYFDKFPNGKYDEIVPLIARVVFSLRIEKPAISRYTIRDEAREMLPKIFFCQTEEELKKYLEYKKFKCIQKEKSSPKHDGGKKKFLEVVGNSKFEIYHKEFSEFLENTEQKEVGEKETK